MVGDIRFAGVGVSQSLIGTTGGEAVIENVVDNGTRLAPAVESAERIRHLRVRAGVLHHLGEIDNERIRLFDVPAEGDTVTKGEDFGALESVKASSELYSPVSGEIVAVNAELEDKPELINEDPYGAWIIKVEMSDKSELGNLLSAAAYSEIAK